MIGLCQAWTYDNIHNITSQTTNGATSTYAYGAGSAGPHAVTAVTSPSGTRTYTYDANGAQTTTIDGTSATTYVWDHQQHLTSADVDGTLTESVYDATGARLLRRTPDSTGGATATLYIAGHEITRTQSGATTAIRYYPGAMRDDIGAVTWLLNDQQNSAQLAVTAGGSISRQRYLPFGENRSTPTYPTERNYLNKTKDPGTGLIKLGARYYDPALAKFITLDPILDTQEPANANPYTYSYNNPTTYSDPTGLFFLGLFKKLVTDVVQSWLAHKAASSLSLGRAKGRHNFRSSTVGKALTGARDQAAETVRSVKDIPQNVRALAEDPGAPFRAVKDKIERDGYWETLKAVARNVLGVDQQACQEQGMDYCWGKSFVHVVSTVIGGGAVKKVLEKVPTPRKIPDTPGATAGPMAGKRLGHTFTRHGATNTEHLLKEAAGSGRPLGQFLDDAAAERFIADHLDDLTQGAQTFPAPPGLGRIENPDGTFSPATRVRLVPSGSGVKTAYPEP